MKLKNYIAGQWVRGSGEGQMLYDASTGAEIVQSASTGASTWVPLLILHGMLGNWVEENDLQGAGMMLKTWLSSSWKEKYYDVSYKTGATRVDSWIDIEGGIGKNLLPMPACAENFRPALYHRGDPIGLSKEEPSRTPILVPKGVALHINAFNFPIWGMLENVPSTGWPVYAWHCKTRHPHFLPHRSHGARHHCLRHPARWTLQLICGNARDILNNYVNSQDVVTFTGSASTGRMLKSHPRITEKPCPSTWKPIPSMPWYSAQTSNQQREFNIFIKEVRKRNHHQEVRPKCTAVRRIMVPKTWWKMYKIAWAIVPNCHWWPKGRRCAHGSHCR